MSAHFRTEGRYQYDHRRDRSFLPPQAAQPSSPRLSAWLAGPRSPPAPSAHGSISPWACTRSPAPTRAAQTGLSRSAPLPAHVLRHVPRHSRQRASVLALDCRSMQQTSRPLSGLVGRLLRDAPWSRLSCSRARCPQQRRDDPLAGRSAQLARALRPSRAQPTSFDRSSVTLTGQWSLPITSAWISAACTAGRSACDTIT